MLTEASEPSSAKHCSRSFSGAPCLMVPPFAFAHATSADRLVLTGVAVSFIVMALANVLIFLGDPRATHTVVFWMLGGLGLAQWGHLLWPLMVLTGAALWFRAVAGALARTLAKNPADRFNPAAQFVQALAPGATGAAPAPDPVRVEPRSRAIPIGIGVAAGLLVVAAAGYVATRPGKPAEVLLERATETARSAKPCAFAA